ncbi:hypothetical protein CRD_01087 [Raphidiopsis brookii D9]|nr:hypothetical protein CRD_01087 [Raphidiopsis brookii D9]
MAARGIDRQLPFLICFIQGKLEIVRSIFNHSAYPPV